MAFTANKNEQVKSGPVAGALNAPATFRRRPYQTAAIRALQQMRFFLMLWRRQGGKSTTLAEMAHFEMMRVAGRLVTYASASLLLGREIIFKESQVIHRAVTALRATMKAENLKLDVADASTHKAHNSLSDDDFADLFEAQRLEFRLWHDKTTFSRTQVIAPNPATARGWTGTVFLDEYGFIRDLRDLMEAVEPIISTDPSFKFVGATTPPKDDAHYSYEMTAPPIGTVFEAKAEGNWYRSEGGKMVHRVDIHDAHLAGVKLYDMESGKELTPEEHFKQSDDKDAHRRNYGLEHLIGGTSAVSLLALETAQQRGVGKCRFVYIDSDLDFDMAMTFLREHLGDGPVGIGIDPATTTKKLSNPTGVAVLEQNGVELIAPLVMAWKVKDPAIADERFERIVDVVNARKKGGPAKGVGIDASNERYYCVGLQKRLRAKVPVRLFVATEAVQVGHETTSTKHYLGAGLVGEFEDNRMTVPAERYVKEDIRLVKKEKGQFVCEPDEQGRHGDTFDALKNAREVLKGKASYFAAVI